MCKYLTLPEHLFYTFQNDFNVAMSLIVNNGIYQKIERDITSSPAYRIYFDGGFWTPELLLSNKPLNIYHIMPSIIALGLGLISSILSLSLEIFLPQKKSANPVVGSPPRLVSESDVSDLKRVDKVHKKGNLVDVSHTNWTPHKLFKMGSAIFLVCFSILI